MNRFTLNLIAGLTLTLSGGALMAEKLEKAIQLQKKETVQNAKSQKKIDKTAKEKEELLSQYKSLLAETESLKVYNEQMQKMINSQKEELGQIDTKIGQIQKTNRDIIPMMVNMVQTLDNFVSIDTPFLQSERSKRLADLKKMMDRADVSTSEKFRRVLEAYQIEVDYGKTIESYKENIVVDGKKKTVNLLRFGRIGLYYVALDRSEAAIWDKTEKNWKKLDTSYAHKISKAIKVAQKQVAPSLLELPIDRPEAI